ncbi:anthrax toxin lethal factor-related metalloendopeptidase [Clostridioides sp. GD02404]|uniref:anthrax toxin lethal factor-related metalloendopeptidase n=1 Tax=Clostridioides sp. GD02404 TaxID=3054354 RepID=UPI0038A89881
MENNLIIAKSNNTKLTQKELIKVNLQIGVDFTLLSKSLKAFYKKEKDFYCIALAPCNVSNEKANRKISISYMIKEINTLIESITDKNELLSEELFRKNLSEFYDESLDDIYIELKQAYLYIKKNTDVLSIEDCIEYVFDVDISHETKLKENPLIDFNSLSLVFWSGETKNILHQMNILDLENIHSYTIENSTNITIYENDTLQSEFGEKDKDIKENNLGIIEQMLILPNDLDYDKDEVENMKNRLANINIKYLQTLKEKDIKIKLINSNLTDEPEFKDLKHQLPPCWVKSGKTWKDVPGIYRNNSIVVKIGYSNPSYANVHSAKNLELHETAHAIDKNVLNKKSSSEEFMEIFAQERYKLYDPKQVAHAYISKFIEEFFAESFVHYYLDDVSRNTLKENCPLTYDFLEQLELEY